MEYIGLSNGLHEPEELGVINSFKMNTETKLSVLLSDAISELICRFSLALQMIKLYLANKPSKGPSNNISWPPPSDDLNLFFPFYCLSGLGIYLFGQSPHCLVTIVMFYNFRKFHEIRNNIVGIDRWKLLIGMGSSCNSIGQCALCIFPFFNVDYWISFFYYFFRTQ